MERQGATPVSYTHLDVYKRQGLGIVKTMEELEAMVGDGI